MSDPCTNKARHYKARNYLQSDQQKESNIYLNTLIYFSDVLSVDHFLCIRALVCGYIIGMQYFNYELSFEKDL